MFVGTLCLTLLTHVHTIAGSTGAAFRLAVDGEEKESSAISDVTNDEWHHLCAVWSSRKGQLTIFLPASRKVNFSDCRCDNP